METEKELEQKTRPETELESLLLLSACPTVRLSACPTVRLSVCNIVSGSRIYFNELVWSLHTTSFFSSLGFFFLFVPVADSARLHLLRVIKYIRLI